MTGTIERLVKLFCSAIVTLNGLWAVRATAENMVVTEGHEHRCTYLDGDQGNYCNVLCEHYSHQRNVWHKLEKHKKSRSLHFKRRSSTCTYGMHTSHIKTGILCVLFLIPGLSPQAKGQSALNVGDAAPDFTLPYATKDSVSRSPVSLSDLVGKRTIVVAFYPADWSTGCTKEVCTMRDNFGALAVP